MPGDQVIDLDELCRTLGSRGHDHPWHIKRMAERVREELETKAPEYAGRTFVIRSLPNAADRAAVAERLGADVIVLAVPAEEAIQRARDDGRPEWTERAIHDWWRHYEPSPLDTELTRGDAGGSA